MRGFVNRFSIVFAPFFQKMEARHWTNGKTISYSGAGIALALALVIFQVKPTDIWLKSALAMSAVAIPIYVALSQICDQFEWGVDYSIPNFSDYPVRLFIFMTLYTFTPIVLFLAILFMFISFSGVAAALFGLVSVLSLIFCLSFGKMGAEKILLSKD